LLLIPSLAGRTERRRGYLSPAPAASYMQCTKIVKIIPHCNNMTESARRLTVR